MLKGLALFNPRSGGHPGGKLINVLRSSLGEDAVFSVLDGGVETVKEKICESTFGCIFVVGGDGTVVWVIEELLEHSRTSGCTLPPFKVIPRGTGNDLARSSRGVKRVSAQSLSRVMEGRKPTKVERFDAWRILGVGDCLSQRNIPDEGRLFLNYFGIGLDAEVALRFGQFRANHPKLCSSKPANMIHYVLQSFRYFVKSTDLHGCIEQLELDGKSVPLPPKARGLVFVNIKSYAGGRKLWKNGTREKQQHSDGILEVVWFRSMFHLARVIMRLQGGHVLGRCSRARIIVSHPLHMQSDGEPWIQGPSTIEINASCLHPRFLME